VGEYLLGATLGEGTFGKVKHAIHSVTKKEVAIKILDKEKIQQQNMVGFDEIGNVLSFERTLLTVFLHTFRRHKLNVKSPS
jgi:serine/threonine protein kinase